jgi:hypothetical protein
MFKVNQKVYMLEVSKIFNYEPTYTVKEIIYLGKEKIYYNFLIDNEKFSLYTDIKNIYHGIFINRFHIITNKKSKLLPILIDYYDDLIIKKRTALDKIIGQKYNYLGQNFNNY